MTALTVTPANVGPLDKNYEAFTLITGGTAIAPGDVVGLGPGGTAYKVDANTAANATVPLAIAWNGGGTAAPGNPVSVIKRGALGGYDLSDLGYGATAFLSNTVGKLDTAAGTVSVAAGRVFARPDSSLTKYLYVEFDWS